MPPNSWVQCNRSRRSGVQACTEPRRSTAVRFTGSPVSTLTEGVPTVLPAVVSLSIQPFGVSPTHAPVGCPLLTRYRGVGCCIPAHGTLLAVLSALLTRCCCWLRSPAGLEAARLSGSRAGHWPRSGPLPRIRCRKRERVGVPTVLSALAVGVAVAVHASSPVSPHEHDRS